ncbi:MAG: response regulator transcription factor [Micrococcales bacterium]|nr:response regulator transcription factor [Micrococcales bacterium]MCL2667398.1 response regulator transcription factor [Micrococcales bacterium]
MVSPLVDPPAGVEARQNLLLVDDDEAVTSVLSQFFEQAGFVVVVAADGVQGLAAYEAHHPDVVVADVSMPVMDGREMVRRIRAQGAWTPVLLLAQAGDPTDRAAAIDEGADDYLNKPCDPRELLSRVRALLRRQVAGQPLTTARALVCQGLHVDRITRQVTLDGRDIVVTPRAWLLLDYLVTRPGELHSREELLNAVWGFDFPTSTRSVDARVSELRQALRGCTAQIETVAGVGYRFTGDVQVAAR